MSNSHEPIYTQDDLDTVLAKLRAAEKEAEQSRQLLWSVVDAVGGEVAIPYLAWLDGNPTKQLIMWDDTATLTLHLKIKSTIDGEIEDEEIQRPGRSDRVQRDNPSKRYPEGDVRDL